MRKFLAMLLVTSLAFSIAACSNKKEETLKERSVDQVQPTEEAQPTTEIQPTEEAQPTDQEETVELSEEELKGNLIPGGYFNEVNGQWGVYKESGGEGTTAITDGQLIVTISNTGSVKHAVQVYCDGFEVLQNAEYKMSFDISSSVDRLIDWRIQINGGDYHAYAGQEDLSVTSELKHYEFTFIMEESSDPAPRLCFNLGLHEQDGALASHTIVIDNVELIVLDDSNADTSNSGDQGPAINVNQIGYKVNDKKIAVFRDSSLDTNFDVINVSTGDIVFSGNLSGSVQTPSAGETVAYADFSSVNKPGTYKVIAKNSGESYEFVIADDVYSDIFASSIKMLYLQRCGSELTKEYADNFAHEDCHTQTATIYGTNKTIDVSGGWHDAGDYGRYVVAGAKAIADLLLAYEDYGTQFTDSVGIPESGNGIPDVLDEARYELEWMLKMQDKNSGGVYHKVTGLNFEGTVMPDTITDELYVMPISNCATSDFAAVMAMAARIYEKQDAAFAKTCLNAAKNALAYVENNKDNSGGFKNPSDVLTGEYPDTNDSDEYFWALCELYKTTGDVSYNNKLSSLDINSLESGLGWQAVDIYGCYAYLTSEKQDSNLTSKVSDKFNAYLSLIEQNIKNDGYFSSIGETYPWGSNMSLANNGMAILMANKVFGKDTNYAKKQLDYLLGANSTSYCFVTGYGTLSPEHTHHRPSQALEQTMKGMLVGGANSNLEDPYAKNVLADKPAAKCYADNSQSYSCNEITIYWNSPFIYLLAGLQAVK